MGGARWPTGEELGPQAAEPGPEAGAGSNQSDHVSSAPLSAADMALRQRVQRSLGDTAGLVAQDRRYTRAAISI